eukprot:scaffold294120_cov18-Prasinocladus_malaysianus.AAC.1
MLSEFDIFVGKSDVRHSSKKIDAILRSLFRGSRISAATDMCTFLPGAHSLVCLVEAVGKPTRGDTAPKRMPSGPRTHDTELLIVKIQKLARTGRSKHREVRIVGPVGNTQ